MLSYLRDDNYQVLRKLASQFLGGNLPEFVKSAELATLTQACDQPLIAFADPVRKLLPTHTKAAAYLSNLYFWGALANGQAWDGEIPQATVERRLEKAAKIHGIFLDVTDMKSAISKHSEFTPAISDSDFALVETVGAEKIRRFPTTTAEAITKSADRLYHDRRYYPYAWRKKAATAILRAAAAKKAAIQDEALDYLVRAAGLYPEHAKLAAARLRVRAAALNTDESRQLLTKAATALAAGAGDFHKLADVLSRLDHEEGQCEFYTQGMAMPEEILFRGLDVVKQAGSENTVELQTGTIYALSDIEKAGQAPFEAIDPVYLQGISRLGGGIVADKAAAVLPTIPRDDARVLEAALEAVGVYPRTKQATATDLEDVASLARHLNSTGDFKLVNYAVAVPAEHAQTAKRAGRRVHLLDRAADMGKGT